MKPNAQRRLTVPDRSPATLWHQLAPTLQMQLAHQWAQMVKHLQQSRQETNDAPD